MRITLPSGTQAEIERVAGATRGLVVIPDIWGMRPLFDDLVRRFASEWGMTTVAIEPFPARDFPDLGTNPDTRFAAVPKLRDTDKYRDLAEAADATGCSSVGLIGFCMGGMYCFKASQLERDGRPLFDRIASFYGMITTPEAWKSETHESPLDILKRGGSGAARAYASNVLAVIGGGDQWTPGPEVEDLRSTGVTVAFYPQAEHGFAHDASRPTHRPDDARDAFERAKNWLAGG